MCLGAVTHDDAADVLEVELVEVGVGEEVGHFAVSTYEGTRRVMDISSVGG